MSPAHLAHVLFYTLQIKGVTPTVCSAIRAAAFILRDLDLSTQADDIVSRITPCLENSFVAAIVLHMAKIMDASEKMDTLNSTLMDSCTKLDAASTAISQCNTTVTAEHTTRLQQLAGELSDVKTLTSCVKELVTSHNSSLQCPSYREALLSQPSPLDDICLLNINYCCGLFTDYISARAHYSRLHSTIVPSVACQTTEGKYHSTNPFPTY